MDSKHPADLGSDPTQEPQKEETLSVPLPSLISRDFTGIFNLGLKNPKKREGKEAVASVGDDAG